MAICIEFELVEEIGALARYRYGHCLRELDLEMEFDVQKLVNGETSMQTPLNEIINFTSANKSEFMAYRVFSKVYKHYISEGRYLKKGGYYT